MKTLITFFIIGTFFVLSIAFLIYICHRCKYSFTYQSKKRKIEIYPNSSDKPHKTKQLLE